MDTQTDQVRWEVPRDLDDATRRMEVLYQDFLKIQTQLGDNDRRVDGRRMSYPEYNTWRRGAMLAHQAKIAEYRWLKRWVHEHQPERVVPLAREVYRALLAEAVDNYSMLTEDGPGCHFCGAIWDYEDETGQVKEGSEWHKASCLVMRARVVLEPSFLAESVSAK